jgi:hypothetical protein
LLAFVIWIYADPWFWLIEMIRVGPPRPDTGAGTVEVASYDHLLPTFGRSAQALSVLRWVALIATILVVIQLFVGRRSGRSLAAWLAATALLAAWLGLIVGYRRIRDDAFRSHARRQILNLERLPESLNEHPRWPVDAIETGFGTYMSYRTNNPNSVLRKSPWWESEMPFVVYRLNNKGLLFISPANRYRFEWHPMGDEPSFAHLPTNMSPSMKIDALSRVEPLGEGWFLTEYEPIPDEWR